MAPKGKFSFKDILNAQNKADKVESYTEIYLNPFDVKPSEQNFYSQDNIQELADSFLAVGQQQPTVLARINGEYRIVSGHRRNLANQMLIEQGHEEFKNIRYLYRDMTEATFELSLLVGNAFNRVLTPYEKVEQSERLKKALIRAKNEDGLDIPGKLRDVVAELLNESPTNIARMDKINSSLGEEAKEQFKQGNMGISAAYETSKLPPEKQKEVAAQVASGSKVQVKEIAEKIQEKKQQEAVERMEKAADRAEKAHDAAVTAAQATLQAERAAESADMSVSSNIQEQQQEYIVSDSDTSRGELFDMLRQYPDADVLVKTKDGMDVLVTDVIYLEEYNTIELVTKVPCTTCTAYDSTKQPELPVLKNNNQRGEFIDSYSSWPIWFESEQTGERYYRYELGNGSAIVVKVHKRHKHYGKGDIEYGSEAYYLTGVNITFNGSKNIYKRSNNKTFAECATNKTSLIDYLKEYQKG
nr:ParB N-terminal domain-containing protein [uncultured Lachnoclostridium sp.]